MAFLAAGSGGVKGETSQRAEGGNADLRSATGNRTYNIGGNPNVQSALQSPWVTVGLLLAVVASVYLWRRR